MIPNTPFKPSHDVAVDMFEYIIKKCKDKRKEIDMVAMDYESRDEMDKEMATRDEGFRGALAWVEGVCIEEINRIRGVVRPSKAFDPVAFGFNTGDDESP